MADLAETVDTYLTAWMERDATRRASMIERVWAADGRLIDPPFAAEGHSGISEMMAAAQTQFPGHHFRRTSGIDAHHDHLRFGWELVAADGSVTLSGTDVGELDADGRLRRITGFFGPLPAQAAA